MNNFTSRNLENQSIIPTRQRRVRHLLGIVARNLTTKKKPLALLNCYFTLHIGASIGQSVGKIFYTSEVVTVTENPTWHITHAENSEADIHIPVFSVQLWARSNDRPELIIEQAVPLSELMFLVSEINELKETETYETNILIFELSDGYYVLPDVAKKLNIKAPEPMPVIRRTKSSYSKLNIMQIVKLQREILRTKGEKKTLTKNIEDKIKIQSGVLVKQQKRDTLKVNIIVQKERYKEVVQQVHQEKDATQKLYSELIPRAKEISKSQQNLLALKQKLVREEESLFEEKKLLRPKVEQLVIRQHQLVSNLQYIFPITRGKTDRDYIINDITLDLNNITDFDEEMISTALGFVSHLVTMISKYLEIPLQHPYALMGSRTYIKEEMAHFIEHPLFYRCIDRIELFEYAVYLLHQNVEQLMDRLGLEMASKSALPNLYKLLYEERDIQRIVDLYISERKSYTLTSPNITILSPRNNSNTLISNPLSVAKRPTFSGSAPNIIRSDYLKRVQPDYKPKEGLIDKKPKEAINTPK
jgi:hypothetical protein